MQELIKNWPSILLFIAGLSAAIATYVANKRSEKQQTNIEELGNINKELGTKNKDLTEEVKKLSGLNISISEENKDLTNQSKILIEEVKKLTVSSNVLINKLDKKADKVIAENAITGELEMEFDATYSENQKVFIIFGGATMEESIKGIGPLISVGNLHPLNAKIRNNKLLISMKVYDMNENLLAEIEDNNWRPNKNFTGKFNYDKKGFEIIDNQGNIAANFDILGPNKIKIQGIFPYKEAGRILIAGDSLLQNPPFGTKEIEDLVLKKTGKKYDIFLKDAIEKGQIKQLFVYTGSNWLHKRK